jgi:hypothetical protein
MREDNSQSLILLVSASVGLWLWEPVVGGKTAGCVGRASVIVAVSLKSEVVSETVTRGAAVVYVLLTLQAGVSAGLRL